GEDAGRGCGPTAAPGGGGLGDLVGVHDPVLQRVPDPAAAVGEQLVRVGVLDVLGDDQDRGLRNAPPRLESGAKPLVAEGWRQADVDDRYLGPLLRDRLDQAVAVLDRRDHLEAVVAEKPDEPAPKD